MPQPMAKGSTERIAVALRPHIVAIDSITEDPANLREHGERSLAALEASLRRFGQQKPVVVDGRGVVIAGNGTLAAAKRLGWKRIAAVRSELAGVERVGFAIADNRIGELSSWRKELGQVLGELPGEMAIAAGYTDQDLADLLQSGSGVIEDLPPPPLPKAVTRRGEIWELGPHRLLCGDSTKAADVDQVLDGSKADLVATDPPYLVDYTGERPRGSGKDWSGLYREVEIKDAESFFRAVFGEILRVLADHAAVYCWHAHRRLGLIQRLWGELGILDHQQIVWVKPARVPGRCIYHCQHEPCVVGWRQGSKPHHDGRGDLTSVWIVHGAAKDLVQASEDSDVWFADWQGKKRVVNNEHPTEKPVELFARPMRKHTQPGAVCFEPFSGSGTQLVAAEQMGRLFRGIEIEPVFVDVAVRRWQTLTGKDAVLAGSGRTWHQVAHERGAGKDRACRDARSSHAVNRGAAPSPKASTASATRTASGKPGQPRPAPRTRAGTGEPGGGSGRSSSREIRSARSASASSRPTSTT